MPSSSIDSCARVSATVPLSVLGQTNRRRSNGFANRQSPSPSHHSNLIKSPRLPRNTNMWPAYGPAQALFARMHLVHRIHAADPSHQLRSKCERWLAVRSSRQALQHGPHDGRINQTSDRDASSLCFDHNATAFLWFRIVSLITVCHSTGSNVVALLCCAVCRAFLRQSYICHGCTPYSRATAFTVVPFFNEARTIRSRSSAVHVRRFLSAACDLLSAAVDPFIPTASRNLYCFARRPSPYAYICAGRKLVAVSKYPTDSPVSELWCGNAFRHSVQFNLLVKPLRPPCVQCRTFVADEGHETHSSHFRDSDLVNGPVDFSRSHSVSNAYYNNGYTGPWATNHVGP